MSRSREILRAEGLVRLSTIRNAIACSLGCFPIPVCSTFPHPPVRSPFYSFDPTVLFYFRFEWKKRHHLRDEMVLTGKVRRRGKVVETVGFVGRNSR